jgi:myo-inositol-1(or 4)-monophosphatase
LPASEPARLRGPLEAAMREAGEIARVTSRRPFRRWTKGKEKSPVSEADIAVNEFLQRRLGELAPEAGWLSEETEERPGAGASRVTWIVDPIDGTRAFIAGRPDWTISVALVEDGRPVLAALYAPVTEDMFLALRGQGATRNDVQMRRSDEPSLTGARIAGPKRYLDGIERLCPSVLPQPKVHSLALRLTQVGSGDFDLAFASGGSHDWDLAAADLLVHEAGGVLTDLTGRPLSFNRPHGVHGALVAAGPARHRALFELLGDRTREFA